MACCQNQRRGWFARLGHDARQAPRTISEPVPRLFMMPLPLEACGRAIMRGNILKATCSPASSMHCGLLGDIARRHAAAHGGRQSPPAASRRRGAARRRCRAAYVEAGVACISCLGPSGRAERRADATTRHVESKIWNSAGRSPPEAAWRRAVAGAESPSDDGPGVRRRPRDKALK